MKLFKLNKKKIKQNLKVRIANTLWQAIGLSAVASAMALGSSVPVNAATTGPQTESNVIYDSSNGRDGEGNMQFKYGTSFSSMTELRSWLVDSVSDTEDKSITVDDVYLLGVKPSTGVENAKFTYNNTSLFWGKQLSAGKYIATFAVKDNGGKIGTADIPFSIYKNPIPIEIENHHLYYLQGTEITNKMLAQGVSFIDSVVDESLTYTDGKVTQGTYSVKSIGGLDSKRIMNNGQGYTFEYYMTHKEECDAANTYTITYEYKGRGMLTSATYTTLATIIPVFPEFTYSRDTFQIHEGYEAVFDDAGKITDFTNKLGVNYLKQDNALGVKSTSIITLTPELGASGGFKGTYTTEHEDCTESIWIDRVTYADGSVESQPEAITTSIGVYGNDLKGTANTDGTFTLEDGTIYPYRGDIDIVLGAVNSYKNSKLSSYDADFENDIYVYDEDSKNLDLKDDEELDEDLGVKLKPQTDPIINGKDRYMFVEEEINRDNILSKLEATDMDADGNVTDITENIVIESIYKYDAYGNPLGQIYINDTDPFGDGKLDEGLSYIDTSEECKYDIKFVIININNRVSSFDITMHVVDSKVDEPYIRTTRLEYFAKVPENLDENGYNIYYDKDSAWMNNYDVYEKMLYGLCHTELMDNDIIGNEESLMVWKFTPDQVKETQSWGMESGAATAGQIVPEDTIVKGWLFEDEDGHYIKYRDEDTQKMLKVYVKSDTIDYGMFPSEELCKKWFNRWYDECCTIDLQHISYQGEKHYTIIRDEDGNYLYEDEDTGKRMVFNNAMNDLKITPEELDLYEEQGYIWEDTRDYSEVSIYKYALDTMIDKYINEIRNSDSEAVRMIERCPDTLLHFYDYVDQQGPSEGSKLEEQAINEELNS